MKNFFLAFLGGILGFVASGIIGYLGVLGIFIASGGVHGSGFLITNSIAISLIWLIYGISVAFSTLWFGMKFARSRVNK